jgi:hypothetical protein
VRLQRRASVARRSGLKLGSLVLAGICSTCQLIGDIGDRSIAPHDGGGGSAGSSSGGEAGYGGSSAGAAGVSSGGARADGAAGAAGSGGGPLAHEQSKLFKADEFQFLHDLSVDINNNQVLLTGHFRGTLPFGNGTPPLVGDIQEGDLFVARLSPQLAALWSRRIATENAPGDRAIIAPGPLGRTVLGIGINGEVNLGSSKVYPGPSRDVFLAMFGVDGNVEWAGRWGDGTEQTLLAFAVGTGEIALAGSTADTLDFGGTTQPVVSTTYLAGITLDGDPKWTRAFPGCADMKLSAVAWGPNGDLALAGSFMGTCDLGDGWVIDSTPPKQDCFAARLSSGVITWAATTGATFCVAGDVDVGPSNEIVLAGTFSGHIPLLPAWDSLSTEVFGVAWSLAGGKLWGAALESYGPDAAESIDIDPVGDAVLSGTFDNTLLAGKLSGADGGLLWKALFQTKDALATGSRAAFNGSGQIVTGGTMSLPLDLGGGLLVPNDNDIFVATYSP